MLMQKLEAAAYVDSHCKYSEIYKKGGSESLAV